MSKIILALLLASFGCGCSVQSSEATPSESESIQLPPKNCLCPVCIGPQYPVPAHAPICLGHIEFDACFCQAAGSAQAQCFAHPPLGLAGSSICQTAVGGPAGSTCCSFLDSSGHCEATYFDGQNETKGTCGQSPE